MTSPSEVLLDFNSGHVTLDSSITQGLFDIHGVGSIQDNTTPNPALTITSDFLVNPESVASKTWDTLEANHAIAGSFGAKVSAGLDPVDTARILDIYRILGLDPSEPLTVSATSREAGGTTIQQTISVAGGIVTVTRL